MAGRKQLPTDRSTADEPGPRRELTVDEIIRLYPGDCVVMHVTAYDDGFWPAKGFVLTHARRQMDALAALDTLPPGWREVGLPLYSFIAQREIGPGPEWEEFLAQLRAQITPPK